MAPLGSQGNRRSEEGFVTNQMEPHATRDRRTKWMIIRGEAVPVILVPPVVKFRIPEHVPEGTQHRDKTAIRYRHDS